jgi:hypothetical protein
VKAEVAIAAIFLSLAACKSVPAQAESAPAESAQAAAWTAWRADADGDPKAYRVGPGLTLTLRNGDSGDGDGSAVPELTISDGEGRSLDFAGACCAPRSAAADFVAAPALDPALGRDQILVRSFTHGAHCCFAYQLVGRRDAHWTVRDLGQWDAAGRPEPADLDGDGRMELRAGDQRFLYAFESYAGSVTPPQVWRVSDGALVDASADSRFRAVFEHAERRYRDGCEDRAAPGACLAYAAVMARLGRLAEAWPLVEAADPERDPDLADSPIECWRGRVYCRGQEVIPVGSFREKVELFLRDAGYLPAEPAP